MGDQATHALCWKPVWRRDLADGGFEHCSVGPGSADAVVLAFDAARRPFRLDYRLEWDPAWRLRTARLTATTAQGIRSLALAADGDGHWHDGDGHPLPALDGCLDIDIWPTPFTNTFPKTPA